MKPAGGDDLDLNVELSLERGQLLTTLILEGVGKLGVKLDADTTEASGDRSGFDAAQNIEPYQLGAGDGAGSDAGRAGTMSPKLESLFQPLTVDLEEAVF